MTPLPYVRTQDFSDFRSPFLTKIKMYHKIMCKISKCVMNPLNILKKKLKTSVKLNCKSK